MIAARHMLRERYGNESARDSYDTFIVFLCVNTLSLLLRPSLLIGRVCERAPVHFLWLRLAVSLPVAESLPRSFTFAFRIAIP